MSLPVISQTYLDMVNEIVPKASAEGAYCIGLVSALAFEKGLEPSRSLLVLAAQCRNIPQAISCFMDWERTVGREARNGRR